MAARGIVRVELQARGADVVQRVLRGVGQEDRRLTRQHEAEERARTRATERAARDQLRVAQQTTREAARAEREAAREREREMRREEAQRRRLLITNDRAEARAMREQLRAGRSQRAAIVGGIAGAAVAGIGVLQGYQGALGMPSRDAMISSRITRRIQFIRDTTQAGMSEEQAAGVDRSARYAAERSSLPLDDIYGALSVAQNRFSDLEGFAANIGDIATAAMATGARTEDMVGTLGEFRRQLGVTTSEIPELIGVMADGMAQGSLEAGDIAANFSGIMSNWTALRGTAGRGMGGAREFLALAQSLGASGRGPEATRTLMENMMSRLQIGDVQRSLERSLGDRGIFDAHGQMTIGIDDLLSRIARSDRMQSAAQMEDVFGNDKEARQALNVILEPMRAGTANPVTELMNVSSTRGQDAMDETMRRIGMSPEGQVLAERTRAEVGFNENARELIDSMLALSAPLTTLETQFPLLTERVGALVNILGAAGIGLTALGALGGGGLLSGLGIGGSAAAAGGTVGGTGSVLGAAAAAGTLGAVAAGGLVTGGALVLATPGQAGETVQESASDRALRTAFSPEALRAFSALPYATDQDNAVRNRVMSSARDRVAGGQQQITANDMRELIATVRGDLITAVREIAPSLSRTMDRGAPSLGRTPGEPGRR